MPIAKLLNNRALKTILLATYVAIESYFICHIISCLFTRFLLSNIIYNAISVLIAYVITDTIIYRLGGSRRKRVAIAIAILILIAIFAIISTLLALYAVQVQTQEIYN